MGISHSHRRSPGKGQCRRIAVAGALQSRWSGGQLRVSHDTSWVQYAFAAGKSLSRPGSSRGVLRKPPLQRSPHAAESRRTRALIRSCSVHRRAAGCAVPPLVRFSPVPIAARWVDGTNGDRTWAAHRTSATGLASRSRRPHPKLMRRAFTPGRVRQTSGNAALPRQLFTDDTRPETRCGCCEVPGSVTVRVLRPSWARNRHPFWPGRRASVRAPELAPDPRHNGRRAFAKPAHALTDRGSAIPPVLNRQLQANRDPRPGAGVDANSDRRIRFATIKA